eukprot:m.13786 g.13786  ORF g.13786 m.13786 type:complete len:552 (-) comp6285_c0_seq2:391-2046(-)
MHFAIPETRDQFLDPENRKGAYVSFSVFINGVYHCSLRYSQLLDFYTALKAQFPEQMASIPFPPKKMLALTGAELNERRKSLERFIQSVSTSQTILKSPMFINFFNSAQKEVQVWCEEVSVNVFFSNGKSAQIKCLTTDQTDDILEDACKHIGLAEDLTYFFGLFLVQDNGADGRVVRRLQEFESPYISLERVDKATHKLMIRRAYWEPSADAALFKDAVAVNMIYVQAAADLKQGRINPDAAVRAKLAELKEKGNKAEYLRVMRTVRNGFHEFVDGCTIDFPAAAEGMCSVGVNEIRFHDRARRKEYTFLITRMRCWKVSGALSGSLELSFEYLKSADKLQWITIKSANVIHLSMTLQFMVDEMMRVRQGRLVRRPADRERQPKPQPRAKPENLVIVPAMPLEPVPDEPEPEPAAPEAPVLHSLTPTVSASSFATASSGVPGTPSRQSTAIAAPAPAAATAASGSPSAVLSDGKRGESSTDDDAQPKVFGRTSSLLRKESTSKDASKRLSLASGKGKTRPMSTASFSADADADEAISNETFNHGIGDDDL